MKFKPNYEKNLQLSKNFQKKKNEQILGKSEEPICLKYKFRPIL